MSPPNRPYSAIFLDTESREKLLQWWLKTTRRPLLQDVFADHVTLVYDPTREELDRTPVGHARIVIVTGWIADDHCQVVSTVGAFYSKNRVPHVTIATDGTPAVYSNDLLKKERVRINGPLLRGTIEVRWD